MQIPLPQTVWQGVVVAVVGPLLALVVWIAVERLRSALLLMVSRAKIIAFFHPYCDNGGGGERVLWVAIHALLTGTHTDTHTDTQRRSLAERKNLRIVIFSGDIGKSKETILHNVQQKFGLSFSAAEAQRIEIVEIYTRTLLEAKWYPVATMLGQSLGSLIVGAECVLRCSPHVFVDSIGAPFTYFVVRACTFAKILAYVHYPIISEDMLQLVREQRPTYNNDARITSNVSVSRLKLAYYLSFAQLYRLTGLCAHSVLVNSSWTLGHIRSLWRMQNCDFSEDSKKKDIQNDDANKRARKDTRRLRLVFPPCNTSALQAMRTSTEAKAVKMREQHDKLAKILQDNTIAPNDTNKVLYTNNDSEQEIVQSLKGRKMIISIGQFRPEKDHMLQIRSMEELLRRDPKKYDDALLVMLGSTRHADDERLVSHLLQYVDSHRLHRHVHIYTNQSYEMLLFFLPQASVGLHTMWNEHFGISVVEMMAIGLVVVAHNSGGPKADIIADSCNGYLAATAEEYAEKLAFILDNYRQMKDIKIDAMEAATRFSDEVFSDAIVEEFDSLTDTVHI